MTEAMKAIEKRSWEIVNAAAAQALDSHGCSGSREPYPPADIRCVDLRSRAQEAGEAVKALACRDVAAGCGSGGRAAQPLCRLCCRQTRCPGCHSGARHRPKLRKVAITAPRLAGRLRPLQPVSQRSAHLDRSFRGAVEPRCRVQRGRRKGPPTAPQPPIRALGQVHGAARTGTRLQGTHSTPATKRRCCASAARYACSLISGHWGERYTAMHAQPARTRFTRHPLWAAPGLLPHRRPWPPGRQTGCSWPPAPQWRCGRAGG